VCSGCICTPRAENKKISGVIYGKICKCTPRQSKSQFLGHFCWAGEIWKVGVVNLVVLACVLRAMSKKVVNSFEEKVFPPRKNPGYAYVALQARITVDTTTLQRTRANQVILGQEIWGKRCG